MGGGGFESRCAAAALALGVLLVGCFGDDVELPQKNVLLVEECSAPPVPPLPDGGAATTDQMLTAKKSVEGFRDEGLAYIDCVKDMQKLLGSDPPEEKVQQAKLDTDRMRAEIALAAERFNAELRAYRERPELGE